MRQIAGWGRTPAASCRIARMRSAADVGRAIAEGPLIARGNGRSYGDPALNPDRTLDMRGMDRMLSFDAETGTLVAEAGVLLAEIIAAFLPRGWFPLVTPGTKFVTLGGAIAADVHGKNHHVDGSFRTCVDWVEVMDHSGTVERVHPADADRFDTICGGMGLSGVILRAAIRLRPVETAWIVQETIATETLAETMDAFERNAGAPYSVAWIDCIGVPPRLGRSIVMLGRHARLADLPARARRAPFRMRGRPRLAVPFDMPGWILNPASLRVFNALYWAAGARRTGRSLIDWDRYFYPLDAIAGWNRIYGRSGFYQFQCALPADSARAGLETMLAEISASGLGSFLSVLKRFGPGAGRFSFPRDGYTLSLDFPATDASRALLDRLDRITIDHGGRFYLAKDGRMSAETAHAADPRLETFAALRKARGWSGHFTSLQSERLGL